MLRVSVVSDNRIEIQLSGELDKETMREGLEQWLAATAAMEDGTVLYRIEDFDWPSLSAIGVELNLMPQLLRSLSSVAKIAVLSERKWIQKAAEIEGFLIPHLEIKAFELSEVEKAEEWLEA